MRISKFSLLSRVIILIAAGLLVGCASPNSSLSGASPSTVVPQSASPTVPPPILTVAPTIAVTPTMVTPLVWKLYEEPHHYFSLEYPSQWHIEPGEPPLINSPIWSFSGLLATGVMTQVIEIGRDTLPIHPSQTIQAWRISKGPGEQAVTLVEQKTFHLNGREVYFVKTSTAPQSIGQTTYFRCGTWVWFVASGFDETVAAEFDMLYENVVNTFVPRCG